MEQIIKKHRGLLSCCTLIFFTIILCSSTFSERMILKKKYMYKIEFIPKEFGNIVCGNTTCEPNLCSPKLGKIPVSEIKINAPDQMICFIDKEEKKTSEKKSVKPYLPVCLNEIISEKRAYKYYKQSDKTIYIRKIGSERWFIGVVQEEIIENSIPQPDWEEEEAIYQKEIRKAQSYSDSELDEDFGFGGCMNLDVLQYVDFTFEAGKYEIYISTFGLESNRVVVEVIYKSEQ